MSELKSRIALAVLPFCENYSPNAFKAAEAVIEALGIVTEEEMDIATDEKPRFYRRYVSEWESSESGTYTEDGR